MLPSLQKNEDREVTTSFSPIWFPPRIGCQALCCSIDLSFRSFHWYCKDKAANHFSLIINQWMLVFSHHHDKTANWINLTFNINNHIIITVYLEINVIELFLAHAIIGNIQHFLWKPSLPAQLSLASPWLLSPRSVSDFTFSTKKHNSFDLGPSNYGHLDQKLQTLHRQPTWSRRCVSPSLHRSGQAPH